MDGPVARWLAGILVAAALVAPRAAQAAEQPNILLILSDDWGGAYYGFVLERLRRELPGFDPGDPPCAGCSELDVATPNLDRLAREGIAFAQGYVASPACSTAHQSLFTGLNQRDVSARRRFGCDTSSSKVKAHGLQTIPEALGRLGYNTLLAGKWHLGENTTRFFNDRTFDPPDRASPIRSTEDELVGETKPLTVVKRFIRAQHESRPWFVVWSPEMPHASYGGIPPHIEGRYDLVETTNPPHVTSTNFGPVTTRDYFESITYFDERVGELVEFLELLEGQSCALDDESEPYPDPGEHLADPQPRVRKRVLCADPAAPAACTPAARRACAAPASRGCDPNPHYDPYGGPKSPAPARKKCLAGTPSPGGRYAGFRSNTLILYLTDNPAGLQESKAHSSENGLRTPIIANYPNGICPTGVHDALVGAIDLFPTILAYAGGAPRPFPDARSFRDLAEQPACGHPWRRYFFSSAGNDATAQRSVVDSEPATIGTAGEQRRAPLKVYAEGSARPGALRRVTDLARDPFESIFAQRPRELTRARYDDGAIAVDALRGALCSWETCQGARDRECLVRKLADEACGAAPTPACDPALPEACRCAGEPGCPVPAGSAGACALAGS